MHQNLFINKWIIIIIIISVVMATRRRQWTVSEPALGNWSDQQTKANEQRVATQIERHDFLLQRLNLYIFIVLNSNSIKK